MSVTSISLKNARAFKSLEIPLKPLTVLLGPNSAGKSTAGQLLAALAHVHRTQQRFSKPTLTPELREVADWPVDLGQLDDLRTQGEQERVEIGLETADGWVRFGFGLEGVSDLRFSFLSHPVAAAPATQAKEVTSTTVPSGEVVAQPVPPLKVGATVDVSKISNLQVTENVIELYRRANNEIDWFESNDQVFPLFDGLVLAGVQRSAQETGIAPKSGAKQDLQAFFNNFTYLRAARERPLRRYELTRKAGRSIGYSGEFTASVLFQFGLDKHPFPSVAKGDNNRLSFTMEEKTLNLAVTHWLSWLGLASDLEVSKFQDDELELRICLPGNETSRNVTEVGFAVSQVLPVLVGGLLQQPDSIFLVDLPEAHLHPAVQARLADFFVALATCGVRTIVETHSELFFHRLRWLVAMRTDIANYCGVLFLDQLNAATSGAPRIIGLDSDDDIQWPVGFMNEQWDLETEILRFRGSLKAATQ
jgi:predicted ATPase